MSPGGESLSQEFAALGDDDRHLTERLMAEASVETLLEIVKQLPRGDRHELPLGWRSGRWTLRPMMPRSKSPAGSLAAADGARLQKLVNKSEQSSLSPQEQEQYVQLAREAERVNVWRAEALAELVRRWKQPAASVR